MIFALENDAVSLNRFTVITCCTTWCVALVPRMIGWIVVLMCGYAIMCNRKDSTNSLPYLSIPLWTLVKVKT